VSPSKVVQFVAQVSAAMACPVSSLFAEEIGILRKLGDAFQVFAVDRHLSHDQKQYGDLRHLPCETNCAVGRLFAGAANTPRRCAHAVVIRVAHVREPRG